MNRTRYALIFLMFSVKIQAQQGLLEEAQKLAQTLPEQALTVDFVITRAALKSDSYLVIKSEEGKIGSTDLQAQSVLDPKIILKAQDYLSKNEPTNPFSPFRQQSRIYSIGAQKYFTSGTSFNADLSRSHTELKFSGSVPFSNNFYQTQASATLSQNLWKDGMGKSTRLGLESAALSERAQGRAIDENKEIWFKDLVQLFYQAWFLQFRVKESMHILERRQHLVEMTRLKVNRGTGEKPDLMQAESALNQAEIQLSLQKENLADIWRNLVVALDFPKEWLAFDPLLVPTKIDYPETNAEKLCADFYASHATGEFRALSLGTTTLEKINLQKEAMKLDMDRKQNLASPELQAFFSTTSNGIDARFSETVSEVKDWAHPAYSVGINLTMPIFFYAEKSALQQSRASYMQLVAMEKQSASELKVRWLNQCENFRRLKKDAVILSHVVAKQKGRAQLEKGRYQTGRVTLTQLIASEDDLADASLQLKETEVQTKILAWEIHLLTSFVRDYLKKVTLQGPSS